MDFVEPAALRLPSLIKVRKENMGDVRPYYCYSSEHEMLQTQHVIELFWNPKPEDPTFEGLDVSPKQICSAKWFFVAMKQVPPALPGPKLSTRWSCQRLAI